MYTNIVKKLRKIINSLWKAKYKLKLFLTYEAASIFCFGLDFEKGCHYVAQDGFQFMSALLPQPLNCCDFKYIPCCVAPRLASVIMFESSTVGNGHSKMPCHNPWGQESPQSAIIDFYSVLGWICPAEIPVCLYVAYRVIHCIILYNNQRLENTQFFISGGWGGAIHPHAETLRGY